MKEYIIFSDSSEETQKIGYMLGRLLGKNDILLLDGDLGAGKTCFTKGISQALFIDEIISSPTYTIVNEYHSGKIPLFHYDVYRLSSEEELLDIGYEENIGEGVIVVEWAVNTEGCFPETAIRVFIERLDSEGPNKRKIRLILDEERGDKVVNSLC